MDTTIQLMGIYMIGLGLLLTMLLAPLFVSLLNDYLTDQIPATSQRWVAVIMFGWFRIYLGKEVQYAYAHA